MNVQKFSTLRVNLFSQFQLLTPCILKYSILLVQMHKLDKNLVLSYAWCSQTTKTQLFNTTQLFGTFSNKFRTDTQEAFVLMWLLISEHIKLQNFSSGTGTHSSMFLAVNEIKILL